MKPTNWGGFTSKLPSFVNIPGVGKCVRRVHELANRKRALQQQRPAVHRFFDHKVDENGTKEPLAGH